MLFKSCSRRDKAIRFQRFSTQSSRVVLKTLNDKKERKGKEKRETKTIEGQCARARARMCMFVFESVTRSKARILAIEPRQWLAHGGESGDGGWESLVTV